MAREALVLCLAAAATLAGCVSNISPIAQADASSDAPAFLATATPLWPDPQNAPHPAWNWPTLAYPADSTSTLPAGWTPIPAAPAIAEVTGLDHVKRTPGGIRGAGIAVFGSLVVAPGFSADTHIVDISDPTAPQVLSTIPGRHRGAAVIAYPSGQLGAVFSTSSTLEFWDITDPANPAFAASVRPDGGSHKVGVVPGTPIVYNANSDGAGASISIFDATILDAPELVQDFEGGYGCHHVYFWISVAQGKYRSICAGVEATQLLDITDPKNPTVVATVPVHHGMRDVPSMAVSPVVFSHFAILSEDGDTLIVGDETGGGIAPGCDAHVEIAGVSLSGPLGDVYFYDVSDEQNPVLQGWFNPGAHYLQRIALPGTCTAHHGRLVPDPAGERDLLAMAYYDAGVVLIDFTDATNPTLVDQWVSGTTWEAAYVNGYIITGDLSRGVDVLRLV